MIESQSLDESLGNLSHHGSVHSAADTMIEEMESISQKVKPKEEASIAISLSWQEKLRYQTKYADTQTAIAQTEIPGHHTPVKERKQLVPEEAADISPLSLSCKEATESVVHKDLLQSGPERKLPTGLALVPTAASTTVQPEHFQEGQNGAPQTPPPPSSSPPLVDFTNNDHETMSQGDCVNANQIDLVGVEENLFSVPKSPPEQGVHNGTFDYTSFTEFTAAAKEAESSKDEFSFLAAVPLPSSSLSSSLVCSALQLSQLNSKISVIHKKEKCYSHFGCVTCLIATVILISFIRAHPQRCLHLL